MASSNRPTGTVTFLFTDIQGSTQLWQQYAAVMPQALGRHHAILRQAVEDHGGYVFQIIGDAFCAAFHTAQDGLRAAIEAQRRLRDEPWGETGPIRVRMALHSGAAEVRPDDYTSGEYVSGLTLSRAARLLSAGHGGQVLLSQATAELLAYDLPEGTGLRDLGEHRLKDLQRPEHIYQAATGDLILDFPPLKTVDAFPNNLPVQLTSFIGREKEIAEIKSLLAPLEDNQGTMVIAPAARLVTLAGTGGAGKSRLSLQVGFDLLDVYQAGVWLVDLAPLSDPELVPQAVASIIGVVERPGQSLTTSIAGHLHSQSLLLILDNCEHLVEACARLAAELLRACPRLSILTTSREALGIPSEMVYNVPSLILPDTPDITIQLEALERNESIQLFVERAEAVQPRFRLNAGNAKAIVQICRRLDGIPLAIEMAAARMKMLSAEQIAARLDARFRLLTDGGRLAPARQQTLHALIDWSYNLLLEPERILMGRLSVFAGSWSLESAEEVCAGDSPVDPSMTSRLMGMTSLDVLELLGQLVNKSLVVVDFDPSGETRYHFLETIRQYAREKLVEAGELETFLDRHLQYFLKVAKIAERYLESAEQEIWMNRLDRDYDNLRAALRWSIDGARVEAGLGLAEALKIFWSTRGYFSEGREWLESLLALSDNPTLEKALALDQAGFLARYQCDFSNASALIGESLDIWRQLGYSKGLADSLANLGYVTLYQGDLDKAFELYNESLQINRSLGNQQGLADTLSHLGEIAFHRKDFEHAYSLHAESLSIWRNLGDKSGISHALNRLASVAIETARPDEAYKLALESLGIARDLKYSEGIAWALELFAIHAASDGQWKQAVCLEAIYSRYRQRMGTPLTPAQRDLLSGWLAPARNALSKESFEQAQAAGMRIPVEQAVASILESKPVYAVNAWREKIN
jgi:predicted ATPase/class 3 adenylate cyclase